MLEVGCPGLGEPQGSGGDELIPAPPGNSEEPPRRLGRELGRRRGVSGPAAAPAPSPAAASPSPCRGQGGNRVCWGGPRKWPGLLVISARLGWGRVVSVRRRC